MLCEMYPCWSQRVWARRENSIANRQVHDPIVNCQLQWTSSLSFKNAFSLNRNKQNVVG